MPKIFVTFALQQEGVSFERKLTRRIARSGSVSGHLDSMEVAVYWLGIGVQHQEKFRNAMIELRPELVINSGFAGGVRTLLEPGDFVLAENYSSFGLVSQFRTDRIFEARGEFACVDAVADPAAKMRVGSSGNVIALDMESGRVAAVCQQLSVPLLSARMISDRYDEEVPGVFFGKGIRQMKDISDAVAFAGRMIALRPRLAERLVELINAIT